MQVEIRVTHRGNIAQDYAVQCSAEEAAQREPWASEALAAPDFVWTGRKDAKVKVNITRIAGE